MAHLNLIESFILGVEDAKILLFLNFPTLIRWAV